MSGLTLTFLGTGTSAGVPMIGCDCATCHSSDPRDQRSRPSVLVSYDHVADEDRPRRVLIDTAIEMRAQILRHRINHIDAVAYTHAHADHIFGLDDLRRFNVVMKRPVPLYAEGHTMDTIRRMFPYVFESHKNINDSFVPQLTVCPIDEDTPFELHGATWTPLRLLHGRLPILGFRVDYQGKSLAYCTDVSAIPPQTYPKLQGLDVLVIDALRYRHHPTHLCVDQALFEIDQVKPKASYFTHIAHDILHAELEPRLPPGVMIAHDGLVVNL